MNNVLRISTLTDRFFEGETTLSEEQELYVYFRQTSADALPPDLRPLQQMFLDLQSVQSVAMPSQQTSPQPSSRPRRSWLVAASLALLLAAGALLLFHRSRGEADSHEECVAYVYGELVTDPVVVLAEMQRTMDVISSDGGDVVDEQLKSMFAE